MSLDREWGKKVIQYLKEIKLGLIDVKNNSLTSIVDFDNSNKKAKVAEGNTIIKTDIALAVADTNAIQLHETDVANLVTDSNIGAVDDTWINQGLEIDCRTYHTIGLWVNMTVNDSTGNQLQVLVKYTTGGVNEYVLETTSDYQKTIGDSDIKVFYQFNVENIPYIQIQTKATDVDTGGGVEGIITIDYTLDY